MTKIRTTHIDLLEPGETPRCDSRSLSMEQISFSDHALESFTVTEREPVIDDVMIVSAAIEFADRTERRPSGGWKRHFDLRIPVFDLSRWQSRETGIALVDALGLLTGDEWSFDFIQRNEKRPTNVPPRLDLDDIDSVIAYSDGMDSKIAADLIRRKIGDQRLIKVRIGSRTPRNRGDATHTMPFIGIPYKVLIPNKQAKEISFRSRGFKFFSISGIAAYLTRARAIIVPESGQGALGSALAGLGHFYPDYRNHPLFAERMERYLQALFDHRILFEFPYIWKTKSETLRDYISIYGNHDWQYTRSCWRSQRWVSVNGQRRQCGGCAACMLRRMSVHAAGLTEPEDTYILTDLSRSTLEAAVDPLFEHSNTAFAEYAYAGFLHLDRLAELADASGKFEVKVHSIQLGSFIREPAEQIQAKMLALLKNHSNEWRAFVKTLGNDSFLVLGENNGESPRTGRLSDLEIGNRLRVSRERIGKTQADAGKSIGITRAMVAAIEMGKRKISIDELLKLAPVYGTSANAILRREAVHLNLVPKFRKTNEVENSSMEFSIRLFNRLVMMELELENVLGIIREHRYPPEKSIDAQNVKSIAAQARRDAMDLRNWLGLESAPIADIMYLLENKLDVRVYLRTLDSRISGLFAYDEKAGACMLLNASHRRSRITVTAAHEIAHLLTARRQPEILIESLHSNSRIEQYANCFSREFLMPLSSVRQRFQNVTAGQTHFTRRHVILLSQFFGVGREVMVRRLEELQLINSGTWDWFQANGGISDKQVSDVLGYVPPKYFPKYITHSLLPQKISSMVREAWKKVIYTEGQLQDLLDLDRRSVRDLVYGTIDEENEENDLVALS